MVRYVANSDAKVFIIATETGLVEQLKADNPNKTIVSANEDAYCRQMKKNSLLKITEILEELPEENLVTVHRDKSERIRIALERMNLTKSTVSNQPTI
jgi:quinolinate synthase